MSANTISDKYRGDSITLNFAVTQNGAAFNLTNYTCYFTMKATLTGSAVLTKVSTSSAQIEYTDASAGLLSVYLTPTDTNTLTPEQTYHYDLEIRNANGSYHKTLVKDTITFLADITR